MNARERYIATTTFGQPDRAFFLPPWYWDSTLVRWQAEGLPSDTSPAEYFGTDPLSGVPVNIGHIGTVYGVIPLDPPFERRVISEEGEHRIVRVEDGQTVRENRAAPSDSMPEWLEYPLTSREVWQREFLPRLDPHSPNRQLADWPAYAGLMAQRTYPLGIWTGSFWGRLQTWMGLPHLSLTFYDNPGWIHEMNEYLCWFVMELCHPALDALQLDYAYIWEDLGMKSGPMVSPRLFREFMLPYYVKLTRFLREHGIEVIIVDSDGQNGPIIPLWLEAGVNGLRPLEAAAGEDPVALRRLYGQRLVLEGGIDKRVLARTTEEIEAHALSRVPWLLTQGGYLPQVDHLVPPDVPFANYCHYWQLIQRIAADPFKALDEARRRGYWVD